MSFSKFRPSDPENQRQKQLAQEQDEKIEQLEKDFLSSEQIVFKGEGEEQEVKAGRCPSLPFFLPSQLYPNSFPSFIIIIFFYVVL